MYAVAGAFVEIRTTRRAQSLAILLALHIRRRGEEPRFPYRWTKIEIPFIRIVEEDVRIISFFGPRFREEEVYLLVNVDVDLLQTKATRH